MASSRILSKDSHTIAEHRIKTKDGLFELYVQEWGNKKGTPIFFFHGGPGAGCTDRHKIPYDPTRHYVVFFDQRGCGLSEPTGSLEHNETKYLIEDVNLIADTLGIDKFAINGGSWGSTLALCYAVSHPARVINMVLSGIFLGTEKEVEWLEKASYRNFFPEVYEFLSEGVPQEYKDSPGVYHRQKFVEDKSAESAYRYTEAELRVLRLNNQHIPPDFTDEYDTTYGTIITHYMQNGCFIQEGHILGNSAKLTMPVHIVQGRYDMVCQPINAYNLHKALPDSQIYWTMAGHSGSDRSNYDVLSTIYKLIY